MKKWLALGILLAFCAVPLVAGLNPPKPHSSCRYEIVTMSCSSEKKCAGMETKFEKEVTEKRREGWRAQGGLTIMFREDMGPDERIFRQAMTYNCEPVSSEPKSEPAEPESQEG